MRFVIIIFVVFGLMMTSSCRKNNNNQVPLVAVEVTININNPQFIDLSPIGGWEYLTGGASGLIVYRFSENEFRAYDRRSTYQADNGCIVTVDEDGIIIRDDPDCSKSSWLITDGSVITGPAAAPLQQYNTSFNPPYLRIYN